jgi:outer membrane protein assembly factor BamE (lipoprotein component of BamABCDE complex)
MSHPIVSLRRAAVLLVAASATLALSACAPLFRQAPPPGAPLAEVTAKLGQPTEVYREPDGGQDLEYRGQPMGQFQWMARIGPDGRLVTYEQVLTNAGFAKVKVDHTTKDEILRMFGRPAEISRVRFHDYEVWSYRYKESGVWNSMMSVHFDQDGIVRQMLNGPDPLYDDRFRHR